MARQNIENARMRDIRFGRGFFMESATYIPADNWALPANAPPLLFLNPAGAIDVLMPTSSPALQGLSFRIVNRGAGSITLKTDGDAAFTAAIVITNTQMADVVCTGSATQASGWAAMVAAGTQTSP
jgi:hypothetical protein